MTTFAFVGLGQMGLPMAGRLLDAGHDLVVWNRTPDKADPLVERGARLVDTPAEAARQAEAVFTMLSTPDALEEVVFGAGGLAEGMDGGRPHAHRDVDRGPRRDPRAWPSASPTTST